MDKAPDAFRTISEVAEDLDVPQHVLRFWETRFNQIKPMKRSGGRRYYRPDDVSLLRGIRRLLYGEGYTIRGVQRILREHGVKSVQSLTDGSADHATALFDGPSFGPEKGEHAPHLAADEVEIDTEDELAAADEPDAHEEEYPSTLSLRDLGPPLTEISAPKAVVQKPVQPAPLNGLSGAEAYAPPNIRKGARPMDRGKLQAALDDLIGARALIDQVLKEG
ncbi:MAG: DNA-binding transcriptional MerR regulator [Afipia broomeae]|nr:MAG: MerR family transcriptional regulator [Bradyrhizobiaceae bacterium]